MSTLNQAFLRAYNRERGVSNGAPVTATSVVAPPPAPVSTPVVAAHTHAPHFPLPTSGPAPVEGFAPSAPPTTETPVVSPSPSAAAHLAPTAAVPSPLPLAPHFAVPTPATPLPPVAYQPSPSSTYQPTYQPNDRPTYPIGPDAESASVSAPVPLPVHLPSPPHAETRLDPAEIETHATPRPSFVPAWEVDELPWPSITDQMSSAMGLDLLKAIEDRLETTTGRGQVVAITSLIRREGRSSVAASLARAAAEEGLRIAIVDADLENPRLTAQLDLQLDVCWVDAVLYGAPLAEAAVRSVDDRLVVFPLTPEAKASELNWSAAATVALYEQLRATYDLVVVDMGPLTEVLKRGLQGGADGPLDGTVLLRDIRITGADQVLLIARELHQAGLNVVGVVDNYHEVDGTWQS